MAELDFEVGIPFYENTGQRCVPACTAMILATLLPTRSFTSSEIETFSGFEKGKATWAAQHLLSLSALEVEVGWIQDEDLRAFAESPFTYIRKQFSSQTAYSNFLKTNDIQREGQRVSDYLELGLPFENRPATQADITSRLLSGWLVRLELNGKVLADQPGDVAHAVMVSGFNDKVVRLENPDGLYGSKPKQIVSWDTLHKAWSEPTMQYYRRLNQ